VERVPFSDNVRRVEARIAWPGRGTARVSRAFRWPDPVIEARAIWAEDSLLKMQAQVVQEARYLVDSTYVPAPSPRLSELTALDHAALEARYASDTLKRLKAREREIESLKSQLAAAQATLRDQFAGQALTGKLANEENFGAYEHFAKEAYVYADAMVAHRNEEKTND
jgi:hypothetical protein